mmetsp:Transcript_50025/g.122122  ORF Transcript_50025/g.122122 Transcript_50025/m.122122 type:complete len:91 (+) Transcript_50025:356-628(+)
MSSRGSPSVDGKSFILVSTLVSKAEGADAGRRRPSLKAAVEQGQASFRRSSKSLLDDITDEAEREAAENRLSRRRKSALVILKQLGTEHQ